MSETVSSATQCPLCGGERVATTGAEEEEGVDLVCQDCDLESELLCSAREVCVGYLPLAGSSFQNSLAVLGKAQALLHGGS